jgi:hypothetical protein
MRNCGMRDSDLSIISSNIPSLLYLYIGPTFVTEAGAREALRQAMPCLVIKQAGTSFEATEYSRIKRNLFRKVPF